MKSNDTITALVALGQDTRLAAYRLLMEHEPAGLPAGDIARRLGVNPSTLSRHLAQLERARLFVSRRAERQIIYQIDHRGTGALLRFLTEDCCKHLGCDGPAPCSHQQEINRETHTHRT